MENNVKRHVEFDGIFLTRNPLNQPYYEKQSVIDSLRKILALLTDFNIMGYLGSLDTQNSLR